ncbi:MAG: 16S rRNA (guanine(527)-N(7))-methyltransferase RsmG [Nocardioidaceae bacterium]
MLFGDHLPLATRYAELLADAGVVRGLIGPREIPRLWDRHLANCAVVADAFAEEASVCDVGAGAGLPGIVLAIIRPDLRVTLLEPLLRRATFLQEAVDGLGLGQVEVVRGRAEEQHGWAFDYVTARAVAPLDRLAGWTLPLCRPGGRLVAMKGDAAAAELAAAEPALRRLGAISWEVRRYQSRPDGVAALVVEVVAGDTGAPSARSRRRGSPRTRRRDR